jgi:hypothetical protein
MNTPTAVSCFGKLEPEQPAHCIFKAVRSPRGYPARPDEGTATAQAHPPLERIPVIEAPVCTKKLKTSAKRGALRSPRPKDHPWFP